MFDRSSPTGPAAGIPTGGDLVGVRSSDQRRAMSTHIGRTCDYVYTHRSRVYRPGRSKESLSSVRTVPIGDDRSKCLRGTHGLSSRSITTTGHHVMRSHCVRTCDRIASRKMENGSRQWKSAMVTGHHGNEQQRSPPDEASGRSSSSNPHGRDLVGVRSSDQRRAGPAWCNPHGRRLDAVPSMVGKSIIADRASDVHTPSFSCQRCAHTKL